MIYTENMLSLFPNRFRIYHSGMWIKRESGVNPGQSRCCEARGIRKAVRKDKQYLKRNKDV